MASSKDRLTSFNKKRKGLKRRQMILRKESENWNSKIGSLQECLRVLTRIESLKWLKLRKWFLLRASLKT